MRKLMPTSNQFLKFAESKYYLYDIVNTGTGWCNQAMIYICGNKMDTDRIRVLLKYLELKGYLSAHT
jgi:hypothetical protein